MVLQKVNPYRLEKLDFGRRIAMERDLQKSEKMARANNVIFDETGNFIIYATYLGIKVVNLTTNKVGCKRNTPSHALAHASLFVGCLDSTDK